MMPNFIEQRLEVIEKRMLVVEHLLKATVDAITVERNPLADAINESLAVFRKYLADCPLQDAGGETMSDSRPNLIQVYPNPLPGWCCPQCHRVFAPPSLGGPTECPYCNEPGTRRA